MLSSELHTALLIKKTWQYVSNEAGSCLIVGTLFGGDLPAPPTPPFLKPSPLLFRRLFRRGYGQRVAV